MTLICNVKMVLDFSTEEWTAQLKGNFLTMFTFLLWLHRQ